MTRHTPHTRPSTRVFCAALGLILFLSACAGKPVRKASPTDPVPLPPNGMATRVAPADPIILPPPADSSPAAPDESPSTASKGVVIVVGGAGVASFALIGLLKRFQMERIKVAAVIATGWPVIPALGFGFLKSIHDVEWMASRLNASDLEKVGSFMDERRLLETAKFPQVFETNFSSKELNQSRVPIVVAAVNTTVGKPDTYDRGDWRYPLGKTMSVPGIYRSLDNGSDPGDLAFSDIQAIDVREGMRRGRVVLVLNFYEDFFSAIENSEKKQSGSLRAYVKHLKADFAEQSKEASLVGKVTLGKAFDDFSQRRLAIVLGYKEGVRLAKALRPLLSE